MGKTDSAPSNAMCRTVSQATEQGLEEDHRVTAGCQGGVERTQEGVLPGRNCKAVFNRSRLIPAILTGFSDSLISLISSFHPILNYLALLG